MTDDTSLDQWAEVDAILRAQAAFDLEHGGEGGLYVAAAAGRRLLMVAVSRPFPKGGYADPVIELGSLACLLGADRLATAITARAWSLDDPVVPVSRDGDLRQRVLSVHTADVHGRTVARVDGTLHPFDLDAGVVRWQDPVRSGPGEGWIPQALGVVLNAGDAMSARSPHEPAVQYRRCLQLGHDVALTLEGGARLQPALDCADEPR